MFDQTALFGSALGIQEPIYIEKIDFEEEPGELHIYMNFRPGGRFSCPVCGKPAMPLRDTVDKVWRHLNFFQFKCYIHMRTPRTECQECGVHLVTPPWAKSGSGFTILFEILVLTMAKAMPVKEIARITGEHDTRLWRIIRRYVGDAYNEKDMCAVNAVGIDETSVQKGHKYISVFADMEAREVLYCTTGKGASTIGMFKEALTKHNGAPRNIKELSMDMSPAFISGSAEYLPQAEVTFDKFHVIKLLNEALDEVRRTEQKKNPLLTSTRYIWLKNPSCLTSRQKQALETLSNENLRTAKVYRMKITFQDIYKQIKEEAAAGEAIKKWLSWAVRSRLEPIKSFARMLKAHLKGVLRYFTSGLTAGTSEGINSRIQQIKTRGKGFKNIGNFISMIYLEMGGLSIPTLGVAHTK
ncbi:MAG: ISL3 family transposase [Clostridia bacterium]